MSDDINSSEILASAFHSESDQVTDNDTPSEDSRREQRSFSAGSYDEKIKESKQRNAIATDSVVRMLMIFFAGASAILIAVILCFLVALGYSYTNHLMDPNNITKLEDVFNRIWVAVSGGFGGFVIGIQWTSWMNKKHNSVE